MLTQDACVGSSPCVGDPEVDLLRGREDGLARLVSRLGPSLASERREQIGRMLTGTIPDPDFSAGDHDMWKLQFRIHQAGVADVERTREAVQACRRLGDCDIGRGEVLRTCIEQVREIGHDATFRVQTRTPARAHKVRHPFLQRGAGMGDGASISEQSRTMPRFKQKRWDAPAAVTALCV